MNVHERNVLITGACGGIGRALAGELARAGATLYLTGTDPERLSALEARLLQDSAGKSQVSTFTVDLCNHSELGALVDWLEDQPQAVNTLVNNAGISRFDMLESQSDAEIESLMLLNSVVPIKLTRALLPTLKRQPRARVVNVSSVFGAIGFPGFSTYAASKYALRGFSQSLARELADSNVSVGCFMPRATRTSANAANVEALNREMKVAMDSPEFVARELVEFIQGEREEQIVGWPENLMARANPVFPQLIGSFIVKKLGLIKRHAAHAATA